MITSVNSVKLNGRNSPGQNMTASPWLTQLVSTGEVVTGSECLQIMYHNITLRKCSVKPNVNPICVGRRVGYEAESGGKSLLVVLLILLSGIRLAANMHKTYSLACCSEVAAHTCHEKLKVRIRPHGAYANTLL